MKFVFLLLLGSVLLQKNKQTAGFSFLSTAEYTMSTSINLYQIPKAEKIEEINNLTSQLSDSSIYKLDLYKLHEDLAVIFSNSTDPFSDTSSISYKLVYGEYINLPIGEKQANGFLPSGKVLKITEWIIAHKLDDKEEFFKLFEKLSPEVKLHLDELGSPAKEELFTAYVEPLVKFYKIAAAKNNAILFIGE